MNHTIIKKPLITEKSLEASKLGRYTFLVSLSASKNQIKQALKEYFNVDAVVIRTVTIHKPIKKTGRRRLPTTPETIKKAIIELKEGQSIKIFEKEE